MVILACGLLRADVLRGPRRADRPPNEELLGGYGTYLWIGLLFGVVNAIVGPILRLLSLPFVVLTLGLFLLVINAALLGAHGADHRPARGRRVHHRVLGGLILAVAGWLADQLLDR